MMRETSQQDKARPTRASWSDRALLGGVGALLVAATMSGFTAEIAAGGRHFTIRPDQVILLALLPAVAVALARRGAAPWWSAVHVPVLAFLAANALASLVASRVPANSAQGLALMTVYAAMYGTVVVLLADHPEWPRRLLQGLVALGAAHALYAFGALVLFASGVHAGGVMFGQVGPRSVTPRSTFPEANLLAAFMLLIAVFCAVRLVSGDRCGRGAQLPDALDRRPWTLSQTPVATRGRRAAWFAGFCLAGLAVTLTVTRAAWLALLLGIVLIGLALLVRGARPLDVLWSMRPVFLGLAVVAVLSLSVCDPLLSRLWGEQHVLVTRLYSLAFLTGSIEDCRTETDLAEGAGVGSCTSIIGRLKIFKEGLRGWRERPLLGHGTLGGGATGRSYWMGSFVQALYDTGVLGALALGAMYAVAVVAPWRASRRARDPVDRDLLLACAIGNALLALTSQIASFLWVGFPWVFMGLTMAAVAATEGTPTD